MLVHLKTFIVQELKGEYMSKYKDDIESLIEEWYSDCTTPSEVATLYAELYHEILHGMEKQMEWFESLSDEE